jgi:DHA1 family tetracycline resistance protein-like MFS transporter
MSSYALLFIFITALLDSIGFGIIMPVIPDLLMEVSGGDLSASARFGGLLMFCFAITQFIFSPVIGNLSDRFGRRPVLLFSLFVGGVNYLIMGFTASLALLFIGRIISGIGAATLSTCNAYITDVSPEDKQARNFGLMGAAFDMGFIIGPVIGGFLGEYGSRMPFFAAGTLSFANRVFGYLVLQESLAPALRRPFNLARANPVGTLLQLKAFPIGLGIISVSFVYNLGHHVLPSIWRFFTLEKFDWSPREIGYSLGTTPHRTACGGTRDAGHCLQSSQRVTTRRVAGWPV